MAQNTFLPFIPEFFFETRHFFAALLGVTQEKITKPWRKRTDEGAVFSYEVRANSRSFKLKIENGQLTIMVSALLTNSESWGEGLDPPTSYRLPYAIVGRGHDPAADLPTSICRIDRIRKGGFHIRPLSIESCVPNLRFSHRG